MYNRDLFKKVVNSNGELTKVVDADNYDAATDDGAGYSFTYDAFGRIRKVRDACYT